MHDRQPTRPGRIKLTDEQGNVKYYTMERADEPLDTGTPLNKATLLSDDTVNMFGLSDAEALPDIVFQRLAALATSGSGGSSVGELEDLYIQCGSFSSASSGWVTKAFRTAFPGVPSVVCSVSTTSNLIVQVSNVTSSSFQYRVISLSASSTSTTTGTSVSALTTTTSTSISFANNSTSVTVNYIAAYYGG